MRARAQDDNNTGTYPLQSERFYAALKGHGAPARLVLLPHESHGAPRRLLGPGRVYYQNQLWQSISAFANCIHKQAEHVKSLDALWGTWTCHLSWGNPGRLVHSN